MRLLFVLVLAHLSAYSSMIEGRNYDIENESPYFSCSLHSDEIFITVSGEGTISIKITNLDADPEESQTYPGIKADDPHWSAYEGCSEYDWIMSTDDADTTGPDSALHWMNPQTLYKIEIIEVATTKASFLFYECTNGSGNNDSFYCPVEGNSAEEENDFLITYYTSSDTYDIEPWGWKGVDYYPIDDSFGGNSDWLWPHDLGGFCENNDEHTSGCLRSFPDYFLTPQTDGSPWAHIEEDLLIIGGSTWGQDLTFGGSHEIIFEPGYGITIQSGATFTVKEGITFSLPASEYVQSNGKLEVEGTESYPVTFQKSGGGNWGGIILTTTLADESNLNYAVVNDALRCLSTWYADDIVVTNSTFDGCSSVGAEFEASSGVVVAGNTSFLDSGGHGIEIDGGGVRLNSVSIIDPYDSPLYLDGGFVELYGDSDGPGNNIFDGGEFGILADDSAVDAGDHGNGYGGDNSIYATVDVRVYAYNGSDVMAEDNWWGTSSPPAGYFYADGTSTISYANPLSTDPNKGGGSGAPLAARDNLDTIIRGDSSPGSSGRFVRAINKLRQSEGREKSAAVLSEIVRNKQHPQRELATRYYVSDLNHNGDILLAVMRGEEYLAEEALSTKAKSKIARELFSVYVDTVKSLTGAGRMRELLETYEHPHVESGLISRLEGRFAASIGQSVYAGKRRAEPDQPQNFHEIDVNAFPNPFKGSTRISFTVEEPSNVELVVYDVLGRQVKQLVKATLSEGNYTFRFDASNLAMGFYYYSLRSGEKMATGKLIYTK